MAVKLHQVSTTEKYVKALVYGSPGSGKTTFACSSEGHPELEPTLVVNIEGGMLSVAKTSAIATGQIRSTADVEEVFWGIANKSEQYKHIKAVVVDSGTELQSVLLDEIVRDSITKKGTTDRDIDDVFLEDYGNCTKKLKRIMRWYRDLPCNVIVTALVREIGPAATKTKPIPDPTLAYPDFTKRLSNAVQGYFDHVWYMWRDSKTGVHSMLTQPAGIFVAKTRGAGFSAALGQKVDNPKLNQVFDLLQREG